MFTKSYLPEETVASRMWIAPAESLVEALQIAENCSIDPRGWALFGFGWRFEKVSM